MTEEQEDDARTEAINHYWETISASVKAINDLKWSNSRKKRRAALERYWKVWGGKPMISARK